MNLSEALDKARDRRESGEVRDAGPSHFDLHMSRDGTGYAGRDFRTGDQMTADRWQQLAAEREGGEDLPAWNPDRAHEEANRSWLASRGDDRVTFEMPGWAAKEKLFTQLTTGRANVSRRDGVPTCPSCDSAGRVDHLDLLDNRADLVCGSCGFKWVEGATAYAPTGR